MLLVITRMIYLIDLLYDDVRLHLYCMNKIELFANSQTFLLYLIDVRMSPLSFYFVSLQFCHCLEYFLP